ncbi:hypothetical protein D3C85_1472070 [compost metagenome]
MVVVEIVRCQLAIQGEVARGVRQRYAKAPNQVLSGHLATKSHQEIDLPQAFALAG